MSKDNRHAPPPYPVVIQRVAERIGDSLADAGLALEGVTASFGVLTIPHDFSGDIVQAADRCLYAAKHQGKARVVVSEA